jgi:cytochrome c-type biogenesis protein CcmF
VDALGIGKISVGRPYFDTMFALVSIPLILLLGIGPVMRWKNDSSERITKSLSIIFAASLALGIILPFMVDGVLNIATGLGLAGALWIAITTLQILYQRIKAGSRLPLSFLGMILAHMGMAVFIAGITMVMTYSQEKDVRLEPGSTYEISGYEFKFIGVKNVTGPNYEAQEGHLEVYDQGEKIADLHPQKRAYSGMGSPMPMTEASVDTNLVRDLYAAMGEPLGDTAWSLRLYYKPMISWIWLGCLFMTAGGVLAVSDRRYRQKRS